MKKPDNIHAVMPGDVFQITELIGEGREGWIGALIMATEVKTWGIQGFLHVVETHAQSAKAFIRVPWEKLEYIGKAVMVPQSVEEDRIAHVKAIEKEIRELTAPFSVKLGSLDYTHIDVQGVRWRFVGGRPVSELADMVMLDCGMLPEEFKPTPPPTP